MPGDVTYAAKVVLIMVTLRVVSCLYVPDPRFHDRFSHFANFYGKVSLFATCLFAIFA